MPEGLDLIGEVIAEPRPTAPEISQVRAKLNDRAGEVVDRHNPADEWWKGPGSAATS